MDIDNLPESIPVLFRQQYAVHPVQPELLVPADLENCCGSENEVKSEDGLYFDSSSQSADGMTIPQSWKEANKLGTIVLKKKEEEMLITEAVSQGDAEADDDDDDPQPEFDLNTNSEFVQRK